jgi:hypothetical protein
MWVSMPTALPSCPRGPWPRPRPAGVGKQRGLPPKLSLDLRHRPPVTSGRWAPCC